MTRPKLLLADDSVTIRKVVELTFADEGIEVTTVADGASAMSKFVEVHPDIVLVDVGLPGTDGYHICEMIKGDESTSHIPVILLVGSFEPFDQDAAEKSGADGFLTKPFHSIRDLVNRVHELLGTQQQHGIDNVIDFDTAADTEAENADIDELYERSFAETMPIDNYETVPAFGADDSLPDEIGEETPANDQAAEHVSTDDAPDDSSTMDTIAVSTEETIDASHHSVDEWLDDEMIETVSSAEPQEIHRAEEEAIEAVSQYEESPAGAVDIEPIKEFDWSAAAIVTAADEKEMSAAAARFSSDFGEDDSFMSPAAEGHAIGEMPAFNTEEIPGQAEQDYEESDQVGETSDGVDPQPSETPRNIVELSPEQIDMIVRKVMERLSDRAVREVAQEAVPRIAEKLMREALEEDRNK